MATITVGPSGRDYTTIQAAINAANRGDTIVIDAGVTYTENVVLKYKATGSGYITIQSSALASLPAAGNRVSPSDASNMPLIRSTAAGASLTLSTEITGGNPASHYKLIGLRIARHNSDSQQYDIISLGESGYVQTELSHVADDIIIDRCYIHGAPTADTRRGIALHSSNTSIINSYIESIHEDGADSQGIGGWNGPGPFLIANNYIEAASENILFGGADAAIDDLIPSDITIEHNYIKKLLDWKDDVPDKDVKNLLELKSAVNVTIRNNIFENCWAEAQNGNAIVFTVRNQSGGAPWSTIQNVVFEYNIVKNVGMGTNILTEDNYQTSVVMDGIVFRHNLWLINGLAMDAQGFFGVWIKGNASLMDGMEAYHNTIIQRDAPGVSYGRVLEFDTTNEHFTNFVFRDNIMAGETADYGVWRDGLSGTSAFDGATSGSYSVVNNVWQRSSTNYPTSNFYVANAAAVGFEDYAGGDYSLDAGSTYKGVGTGGADPGVNWAELQSRTQYVEAGTNYGSSGPTDLITNHVINIQ